MIIHSAQYDATGRVCFVTTSLDAPAWWRAPWHEEYIHDEVVRQSIPGILGLHGPLWRIGDIWLLYIGRRPELCAAAFWLINPVSLLSWPLWQLWQLAERHAIWPLVGWLFVHDVLVWPECRHWDYRDLFKALWFTAQACALKKKRRLNKERK